MHKHDVGRAESVDVLARLHKVRMRTEGDVVDRHVQMKLLSTERVYLLWCRQNVLCKSALHRVTRDNTSVTPVLTPHLKQLSTQSALEHAGTGHDNRGTDIFELLHSAQTADVPEHKGVGDCELPSNAIVHVIDVRLVHRHAFLRQRRRVVYGYTVQLRMVFPVFIENEKELLSTPKRKDGQQTPTATLHNVVNQTGEAGFPFGTWLVNLHSISGLDNENVRHNVGDFGSHQVAILLPRKVARVEYPHTGDFDHEHAGTEHVPGVVTPKLHAVDLFDLMCVDRLDFFHAPIQVLLVVEHVLH
eukprot:Opistho-2@34375